MGRHQDRLDEKAPVIIIRKRPAHHEEGHGGAWKVAYADFVTAMMALFIVLWIVAQSPKVKSAVAGYFKDPTVVITQSGGPGGAPSDRPAPLALPMPSEAPPPGTGPSDQQAEDIRRELERLAEALTRELKSRPELAALAEQVTIEVTPEGLRLEARETSEASFFDVGTANLRPEARAVLGIIAREVGKLKNRVVVEGHTDSRRYSRDDGYTNFELSADRANSARRVLVASGVARRQVSEVRGYADTRLKNAADPLDPANRRISILVKADE
jgi:chemotaxis protein MotB